MWLCVGVSNSQRNPRPANQRAGRSILTNAARTLCEAVYSCDGMLWSSPLYHGTISGSFKNTLDWLQLLGDRQPAYLTDKVIGLISTEVRRGCKP